MRLNYLSSDQAVRTQSMALAIAKWKNRRAEVNSLIADLQYLIDGTKRINLCDIGSQPALPQAEDYVQFQQQLVQQLSVEELVDIAPTILKPVLSIAAEATTTPPSPSPHLPHPRLIDLCEFPMKEFGDWSEHMGFDFFFTPENTTRFAELYAVHDPALLIHTKCLMPFERCYVIQLVAIIVCALTKIRIGSPTPTLRTIVDFSWRNLCRLGIKLPTLKNLVATVMLEAEAGKGIEEEARGSWEAVSHELQRMGFDCTLPKNMLPFVELYYQHDPTLLIQTSCLIQFEQSYVLQLVAIIVGTLTKTFNGAVTPVLHSIVDFSWESLCRLGIKLPVLEKLVATSKKPTLAFEARRGIQEAAKSWRAISDEVDHMKEILASKEEELQNKYNEQGGASKEVQNSQGQLLGDEVGHLRRLVASIEEELQNSVKVFNEKSRQLEEVFHLKWCSLP